MKRFPQEKLPRFSKIPTQCWGKKKNTNEIISKKCQYDAKVTEQ